MKVLQAQKHTCYEESCLLLVKFPIPREMVSEITSAHHVNNKIEILSIIKSIVHIDQHWMIKLTQKLLLIDDGMDTSLGHHARFQHFLHCIDSLCFLLFNLPNFAKTTTSDNITEREVVFTHLLDILFVFKLDALTVSHVCPIFPSLMKIMSSKSINNNILYLNLYDAY